MSLNKETEQDNFWRLLEGQHVRVPYLPNLFPSWKARLHSDYERARDEVLNPWIRTWVDDDMTCRKLQKAEFGVFAAILCADAPFDRLCTVAKYFAWYFIWDDIFDCGALQGQPPAMKEYRDASMEYIKHQLLPENPCPDLSIYPLELQKALDCWEEVGAHIRSICDRGTCEVLSEAMLDYISAVGDANALFHEGSVPSVEAYWRRRDYAAGVYPTIATIPFALGVDITPAYAATPEMQALWKSTSYLVHITNDMLSLRKELRDGQIENIVPVLMLNEGLNINEAIQRSYHFAEENARGVESTGAVLLSRADGKHSDVAKAFTRGCMDIAAGLIHWSYSGQRYFKATDLDAENVLHFCAVSKEKMMYSKIPAVAAGSLVAMVCGGLWYLKLLV
ncbi:terpenoid synthase [Aspergillus pseudodeflectus]|uniref:Terpene synthase n=1 Tax=Aspergillus pseudodeflectus TaxID=176178 RepID=A0ABR4JS58_9EURO